MKYLALFAALGLAASAASAQVPQSSAPDNSKVNKDPVNSSMQSSTADGQSNSEADLKITQQIRKSVMADKSLSTYAHNVKIITVNGAVTLNGTVRSDREKKAIAMKAQSVAGQGNVTNDLTIAPKS